MADDLYYRVSVKASSVTYDLSDDLSSLAIDQREGRPTALTVEVSDPFKVLGQGLQEGMDVEVELGTDDDHALVFRGRIYKVDQSFPTEQTPAIKLQAYDSSMRMGLRKRNRPFVDMSLSDIVREIAANYFTKIDVALTGDPTFPGNGIRQQEETDLAFLRRLAASFGCVSYVTAGDAGDTFHFITQDEVMRVASPVSVYYGRTDVPDRLLSFQSSVDASQIELPRVLSGIDPDTGELTEIAVTEVKDPGNKDDPFSHENLTAFADDQPDKASRIADLVAAGGAAQTALRAELGKAVREATPTFITEAQQSAIAKNQFSTSLNGMRGRGGTTGNRQLVAQSNITIGDVGARFSGKWFLSQVRHVLDGHGYRTEFECRR